MLLINCSTQVVEISTPETKITIENKQLEQSFPQKLYELFAQKKYSQVYLVNGPSSFTMLRIVCLALNSLQYIYNNELEFFSISKLDLYHKLSEKSILLQYGVVGIGQKKNVWLFDTKNSSHRQITMEEISSVEYHFNDIWPQYSWFLQVGLKDLYTLSVTCGMQVSEVALHDIFSSVAQRTLYPDYILPFNVN